jgi:hypothetical protein
LSGCAGVLDLVGSRVRPAHRFGVLFCRWCSQLNRIGDFGQVGGETNQKISPVLKGYPEDAKSFWKSIGGSSKVSTDYSG